MKQIDEHSLAFKDVYNLQEIKINIRYMHVRNGQILYHSYKDKTGMEWGLTNARTIPNTFENFLIPASAL